MSDYKLTNTTLFTLTLLIYRRNCLDNAIFICLIMALQKKSFIRFLLDNFYYINGYFSLTFTIKGVRIFQSHKPNDLKYQSI